MVYARVTKEGPIIEYSGTGARAPEGYIIVDEETAKAELLADEQRLDDEVVAIQEQQATTLSGAYDSLTKGLPLTDEEAKALGAWPLEPK